MNWELIFVVVVSVVADLRFYANLLIVVRRWLSRAISALGVQCLGHNT